MRRTAVFSIAVLALAAAPARAQVDARMLRYVLICDDCGEEMKEILAQEYAPKPLLERAA